MMKLLHVALTTAVVGISSCEPRPVHAGVGTAAWVTAGAICRAMANGLSMREAVSVGMGDNRLLWAAEMQSPLFPRLVVAETVRRCPDLLKQNAPVGGTQL